MNDFIVNKQNSTNYLATAEERRSIAMPFFTPRELRATFCFSLEPLNTTALTRASSRLSANQIICRGSNLAFLTVVVSPMRTASPPPPPPRIVMAFPSTGLPILSRTFSLTTPSVSLCFTTTVIGAASTNATVSINSSPVLTFLTPFSVDKQTPMLSPLNAHARAHTNERALLQVEIQANPMQSDLSCFS